MRAGGHLSVTTKLRYSIAVLALFVSSIAVGICFTNPGVVFAISALVALVLARYLLIKLFNTQDGYATEKKVERCSQSVRADDHSDVPISKKGEKNGKVRLAKHSYKPPPLSPMTCISKNNIGLKQSGVQGQANSGGEVQSTLRKGIRERRAQMRYSTEDDSDGMSSSEGSKLDDNVGNRGTARKNIECCLQVVRPDSHVISHSNQGTCASRPPAPPPISGLRLSMQPSRKGDYDPLSKMSLSLQDQLQGGRAKLKPQEAEYQESGCSDSVAESSPSGNGKDAQISEQRGNLNKELLAQLSLNQDTTQGDISLQSTGSSQKGASDPSHKMPSDLLAQLQDGRAHLKPRKAGGQERGCSGSVAKSLPSGNGKDAQISEQRGNLNNQLCATLSPNRSTTCGAFLQDKIERQQEERRERMATEATAKLDPMLGSLMARVPAVKQDDPDDRKSAAGDGCSDREWDDDDINSSTVHSSGEVRVEEDNEGKVENSNIPVSQVTEPSSTVPKRGVQALCRFFEPRGQTARVY